MNKATGAYIYTNKYGIVHAELLPAVDQKKSYGKDYDINVDMLLSINTEKSLTSRSAIHVWEKFSVNRAITKTIIAPDALIGFLNITFIKNHPKQWAITTCIGYVCLIKPHENVIQKLMYVPGNYGYHDVDRISGKNILLPLHSDLAYIMLDETCEHAFLSDLVSIKKYYQEDYQHRIPIGDKLQYHILFGKNDTIINFPELTLSTNKDPINEMDKFALGELLQDISASWLANAAYIVSVIYDLKYNNAYTCLLYTSDAADE